jgi:tetratricopeptide (TPR) repeat protein
MSSASDRAHAEMDFGRAQELQALAETVARADADEGGHAARRLMTSAAEVPDAVRFLIETDVDAALRMTAALNRFWQDAGLVDEGRQLTETALARAHDTSGHAYVAGLLAASELAFRQGDQLVAEQHSTEAIDLASAMGNDALAALGHVDLARIAFRVGDAPRIEEHALRALELAGHDAQARRGALHMLAWAAYTAGDIPAARARFEASLAFRRELGDLFSVAVEIANIGDLAMEAGDHRDAASRLAEALEVARDLDSQYLIVNLLPSVAALAARVGEDEGSALLLGAANALASASGLVPDPGKWQPALSDAEARLGRRFDDMRSEGAGLDRAMAVATAIKLCRRLSAA